MYHVNTHLTSVFVYFLTCPFCKCHSRHSLSKHPGVYLMWRSSHAPREGCQKFRKRLTSQLGHISLHTHQLFKNPEMSALQSLIRRTASRAPTQTSVLRSYLWNSASQPRRTFAASAVVAAEQDADPLQSAADGARGEALIRQKLQDKFNPSRLDVQDVSGKSNYPVSLYTLKWRHQTPNAY